MRWYGKCFVIKHLKHNIKLEREVNLWPKKVAVSYTRIHLVKMG